MEKRKLQGLILQIVIVVGILIIIGVLWSMNQSQTKYLTYKDTEFGFQIDYPDNWTPAYRQLGTKIMFHSPKETPIDTFQENLNVVVQDLNKKGPNITLEKYTENAIREMRMIYGRFLKIVESNPTKLDGMPAYNFVFTGQGPVDLKIKCVWAVRNQK